MKKRLLLGAAFALVLSAAGLLPVGDELVLARPSGELPEMDMDLTAHSADPPERSLRLLFIHHSVGGQLLADRGPDVGRNSIYESHPEGGGLRARLEENGYLLSEASYGSRIGERTDLFDWLPKFRDHMDDVLRVARQDETLPAGIQNDVVMFKSCFPNSKLVGRGEGAGNPAGPTLTLANAKATMSALLPHFAAHPQTLFVYLTAPPLAPRLAAEPLAKTLARKLLGRSWGPEELRQSGALAREFNAWLVAPNGWLRDYPHDNVVVFDYWDVLTGEGQSDLLHYYVGRGYDAHPSGEGQRRAAAQLVDTLNRAVRRARLTGAETAEALPSPRE